MAGVAPIYEKDPEGLALHATLRRPVRNRPQEATEVTSLDFEKTWQYFNPRLVKRDALRWIYCQSKEMPNQVRENKMPSQVWMSGQNTTDENSTWEWV